MFKKCLIFLSILSISYLCPICSSAQSDTKGGPAKDICSCKCYETPRTNTSRLQYIDDKCTDFRYDYEDISDEVTCKSKNKQSCRGHVRGNFLEPDGIMPDVCRGPFVGELDNCELVGVPK